MPMKVYCDNKVAINVSHIPIKHAKTKHMEVDHHFINKNGGRIDPHALHPN